MRRHRAAAGAGIALAGLLASGCGSSTPAAVTTTSSSPMPSAGTVSRAGTTAGLGSVAIIGDSLTHQDGGGEKAVTASLQKAGWPAGKICYSGVDGRTVADTLPGGAASAQDEVKRCRAKLGEPKVWIISLVSNNLGDSPAQLRASMDKLLAVLGPDARILWVNAGRSDLATQNILTLNPVLTKKLEGRPNTRIADWFGYLKAHPDQKGWWQADGTHMTPAGYAHRNSFLAEQAKAFAQA